MGTAMDLIEWRFGRLVVKELFIERRWERSIRMYKCLCDCGEWRNVPSHHLLSGHTQSCGCYQKERAIEAKTTHGRNSRKRKIDRTLAAYKDMKTRVLNSGRKEYKNYGGRGIDIDPRWLRSNSKEIGRASCRERVCQYV